MDTVGPVLEDLLAKATSIMETCGQTPGHIAVEPGNTVAWDNCCDRNGQMWTRVVSIIPQPVAAQPCDITILQVRIGLGAVRCVAGLKDDGSSPSVAEKVADARQITRDSDMMLRAIREWAPNDTISGPNTVNMKSLKVEQGTPLGPEGFCAGWEWTLVVQISMRSGCDSP